jgi:hypothetical protein
VEEHGHKARTAPRMATTDQAIRIARLLSWIDRPRGSDRAAGPPYTPGGPTHRRSARPAACRRLLGSRRVGAGLLPVADLGVRAEHLR